MSVVNEDLVRERKSCTFDVNELIHLLDGGVDKTENRRKIENLFLEDPELIEKVPTHYLSHAEKYEDAVRKACVVFRKLESLGFSLEHYRQVISSRLGGALFSEGNPFSLHFVMFIPALMGLATDEQKSKWLTKAMNKQIMGTYAQTELGHGTFLRGLETISTYDEKTKEFVLHSPTLTSFKWWPGSMGHTANHAVVMAQLYSKGKCHGIHPFIVQLRDTDTHMPMPGIKIGEIGTKLGMNTVNQGFLGFDHVRIPREHMLMKNSQVLEDGTYIKPKNSKLNYGTMMFVRAVIPRDISVVMGKAVTIATRYAAVRHQSEIKPGEPEPQIMEYKTQQYKLFPGIATVYCYKFVSDWLWELYSHVTNELNSGELHRLPELHAVACCLKAVCSNDGAAAIEICRLACGGHGYMNSSNLPNLYGLTTAAITYEGENTVMFLQTARYLIKQYKMSQTGAKIDESLSYLHDGLAGPWENTVPCIIRASKQVALGKIRSAAENLEKRVRAGNAYEDAWNMTSIELVQCAEAHCRVILIQKFYEEIEKLKVSPALHTALLQLVALYGVYWTLNKVGDFLRFSSLPPQEVSSLQHWMESLLEDIRPNAIGLVDGFDFSDRILNSALGAYDGRVYERLFEEAQKSPLNQEPVNISFQKYLKPFMRSNL